MEITTNKIDLKGNRYSEIHVEDDSLGLSKLNDVKDYIKEELGKGNKFFALDLADVKSINSSGLGLLINCMKMVKDAQGDFVLCRPGEKLLHIFKITKLDSVFEIIN